MSIHTFDMWPSIPQCGAEHRGARVIVTQDFRRLPRVAQCPDCLAILERSYLGPQSATRDHILSASLFCGALAGALHAVTVAPGLTLADLVAAYVAGDASLLEVILDAAEERGLDAPGNWPHVGAGWPEATGHEHVWLPWRSGDAVRTLGVFPGFRDATRFRRCPCGMFEHEHRPREWADTDPEMQLLHERVDDPDEDPTTYAGAVGYD